MSREGANNRIDSLKNTLNTDHYQRSALGNAVRFNTMLSVLSDLNIEDENGNKTKFSKDDFTNALEKSVTELREDFDSQLQAERDVPGRRFDNEQTIQQKLQNRAYKTELGQTVAHATVQRKGMYQDFNTSYSTGATGAFRSFTNGFVQDDEDFFGSRVLYDNVFGQYEDGTESLSNKARLAMSDPTNDNRTVTEKIVDNIVNKSIYDQTEIIDRVDIEFGRFHGNSMIDAMSMTGSGLKAARQTIRNVMQEGSAYGRQVQARGSDDHPVTLAQALVDRTGTDLDTANSALKLLNNNLSNRSSTSVSSPDSGYVNKAGVAEFIDLINTAGTRDSNGALTGGRISISSFQFQNETISAALSDKIQRHVLESVLQGGGAPLQIDMTLAYPRQRNSNKQEDNDGRYAVGMTNYGILGPNLIEAMKLQEVENNIQDMLIGLGVSKEDIAKYVSLNIQFRDKKFHPKVYFTDNVASIGTQNLTAPVGNSVNQAGSNFETMRFVSNTFKNDTELQEVRNNLGLGGPNHIQNNQITQSLLYRQIVNAAEQERTYNQNLEFNRTNGNTSTPILNQDSNSQVGFAGDIYQHISNTLAFAHSNSFESIEGFKSRNLGGSNTHMFMILDQAFMLQLGSTSFGKQLAGEMGAEVGITYEDEDNQTRQYKIQQNRLFDLLIADKANVVVDTKNYNEQVMKPLLDKINALDINTNELKNSKLVSNFEKHGQSLSMMAGFDLFKPSASQTKSEYDQSLNIMFKELRRLGFTKEAGFDDSDLKQIIGMASGNIEMANVPRQHAKEAALFQYDNSGKAEIISYYQGSSNLGLYSLGIGSGKEGQYQAGDGDLTNTELGIMLGRRDINNNLSRSTQTNLNVSTEFFEGEGIINSSVTEWALNNDEELSELIAAQRHFSVTWQQLARTNIDTIHTKKFDSTPSWQDNVNTKDLVVLRNRLEGMAKELGLSSDVFKVSERYGDKSGSGITSINVSIDMNKVMTSSEFARPSSNLPRLNFELSVLQGPSRGEGMFHDSASEGDVSGYVYFVDKNRVIGNGLFSNDSGQNITVLGRHNYEDKFENNLQEGRINLKSGQSAHMSSLDIVPQLFATLMGEAVSRFGTASSLKVFDDGPDNANNYNMSSVKELLLDYVAINLTGYSTQIDESVSEGSNIVSSMKQIQNNLDVLSLQDLNETINRHARSIENRMDSSLYDSQDPLQQRKDKQALSDALGNFNNKWFHHLRQNSRMSESDVHSYINDLHNLVQMSPQLANMVVKTAYKDPNETANRNAFKDFQTLLFGSFLQTNDERTYGGQQGFYKTLLMGLGNSTDDKNTASLMFDVDVDNPSLRNLGAYARFKPLEYNPLTDVHDVLYRSIASKSTSLLKNDDSLDSMFLESEARDLGDSANLRLMSSIGVGNTLYRDDFIKKNESGLIEVGKDQKEIFDSMELAMKASGQSQHSIDLARKAYLDSVAKEFGDLDSEDRNDTVRLSFYTGNSKKLSQLPQRIKNAMGARPMYQLTVEAQMAVERGESLNELSEAYLNKYREPIVSASKNKVIALLNEREQLVSKYGETDERVIKLDNQIDDLKVIGSKAFNNKVSGLGAIFSGRVKSVLNQEQINFIVKTKTRLYAAMGDLVESGELSNDALDELVRVEILKAGLTNKGLGKMLAGNNHMNYSMALVQLAGTYNDTFLANPLYGTTYKSKEAYDNIQKSSINIYDPNLDYQDRDNLGVNNLGMKEGHYRTKQQSVKSSMIGAGGMEVLIQNDDIVVEDKATGNFVHKRKVDGEWKIIGQVDDNRNVQIIKNVVDRTGFSEVGSSGLGSSTASTYGRKGQNSVDYIYNVENRSGNFANNEYLLDISRITASDPSSGQRVEGTDSSALIKGVAVFAGRVKYSSLQNAQGKEQNVFENIEEQIMRSYSQGEIKGSLKSYLDYSDQTQKITLQDGREAYAPLSSSIHGLYNANNFKSFFWSHGATILRSEVVDSQGQKSSFMLDNLFNQDTDSAAIDSAKKIAGAFLVNFGTEFLQDSKDPAKQKEIDILKRSLVSEMVKGSYGSHYQKVVLEQTRELGNRVNEIFENSELRKGRSKEDITSDLLFKEITKGQAGFNSLKTGALTALTSSQLNDVLKGDIKASRDLINLVRTGMIDPVANRAKQIGGINFTNSADTQAALLVTAIDLMHQISGKGNQLKIPTDINFDSDKVKDVLLTLIGANKGIDDETTEDIMEFLSGVSSNVPTISVFTDIIFSYSKDPTSTQSVARHEGQHLITPFMGDIQKYQEGGKLSNIQHTVASITAMVTGQASGMVFYDRMAKEGFKEKTATNLISEDSDYLFSSFNKQQFLGFYQKGVSGVTTDNFVKEYKLINRDLLKGKYDWESINVIRDVNDKTKISDTDESYLDFDEDGKPGAINKAHAQVKRFVDKFHANDSELEKARVTDQLLKMGGDKFALHQLNVLTNVMSIENAKYQADTSKSTGRDTVSNLLENMTNKREYFSLPELSFEMQNGEIIARASNTKSLSTMLPSAQEMRVLGAEYSDFVDPVLNHYKNLSSIFVPGTVANTAFEKVRLAARENRAIVLSTEEYKAMAGVMDSSRMMIPELQKASAGSRTQEAFGGKEKYQGFTSTGIGNLLVPFDSVALAQSKLDEAGMVENLERFELMRQSDIDIKTIEEDRSYYIANGYKSPSLSDDPWLDSITGKTIPHSNSIDYKNKPKLRSNKLLPSGKYFTQKERFGPSIPITLKTASSKSSIASTRQPVLKRQDNNLDAISKTKPETVTGAFNQIQDLLHAVTNEEDLGKVSDLLESRIEDPNYSKLKQNKIQSLLDEDIPKIFENLQNKPFTTKNSFFTQPHMFGPELNNAVKKIDSPEPRIIDNPEIKTPRSELPKNSNKSQSKLEDEKTQTQNKLIPQQKEYFDKAEVTVGEDKFIYTDRNGWEYHLSDESRETMSPGDVSLEGNLHRNTGLRDTLQKQLESTTDNTKQKILQKQIDLYNLRIKKGQDKLALIEKEFNKQYNLSSSNSLEQETKPLATPNTLEQENLKQNTKNILDSTSTADLNPLGKNIINFYRRQKAAEAFGISKSLEQDFKNMKKEAIAVKNKILDFAEIADLPEAERRAAFNSLYEEIKTKRDIAYRMSSLDESTGDSISNKNSEYAKNIPSEADRYIYHAQALNYDSLLAQLSIIGHQANLRPLTEQNVKEIETKAKQLSTIKFLLNSNEDAQGASTFIGLSHKQSNLSEGALFTNKALSEGGGMVGQHMKNIQSLASELRGLNMGAEAKQVKTQYAIQQIEATIQMYEKRMADMQAFSAERSVHSSKKDAQGNPLIDEKVQRNIDTASEQYNRNTLEVISYLKDKKAKLLSQPVNNDQVIRSTFEDIDVKIAEVDTANIYLAEVFRSPPPGGTDPRIHTYRVMQGVSALNQLSRSLSDNKEIGAENRMIYSTERGQTATMLASLGVVTLGGGDYDGDPYTVIFHQASKAQSAVDKYKGRITQNELLIKSLNNEITELQNKVRGLDPKNSNALKQRDQLEARITTLIERRAEKQNRLIQDSSDLQEAKSNLERQITDGHRGLQARARKQVANYLGMDERLFVSSNEVMFDTNGKAILNEDGVEQKGLNSEKTYDADALVVLLEKGYNLMDGIQSSHKTIMGIMDSIDILTGYRSEPKAFQDGKFIEELTSRENLVSSPNGKISAESPAIGMLKARVARFQANMEQLTPDQKQFVNSLKDAPVERYIAYLEQFKSMQTEMDKAISLHNLENQQKAEGLQKDFSRRAFMNQWIGGELYNAVVADKTLGKFMTQGVGMTLTEGTFDMTLKTLGKAGGEVLGKTYNTIIGTTFQDAPIISYGRQILDEESELHKATLSEFQKQAEGNSEKREKVIEELKAQGIEKNHPDFNKLVTEKTRALGYEEFDNYVKVTQKAVLKSEGTQGFMKNIHQLLRDSIKLKSDGDLLRTLQESSENYDKLSKQIVANDEGANDAGVKQSLIRERDAIIGGMSSKLGPGPGLKSLIDLDYLTNESSKTGLSRTDFESRFLTVGGIDSNRQMLNHYAESMTNLTEEERRHLTDPSTIGEESSALLKVARNMTAQNLANMVTSFRMEATAVEGRTDLIKGFARDHKAKLATQLGHHSVTDTPRSVMQDGVIEQEDQTGKYIQEKYGIIESENSAGRFDTNRQHKNALGAHLGIEEGHIYNEDGTMSDAYRNKLEDASKKLNISSEEYTLMFDIHHETSREQVKGVFGEDGKEMEQFTVMNMMRKNIARSMLDGRIPSAEASKTINESMGSEVLTTMAQLAAQNKLDSKGMEMFSGMHKGVVGHLLDATDGVVEYVDKSQRDAEGNVISERKTMQFSEMNAQQKGAYMTKLLHQTMLGTEVSQESGFTRSTSQEARDFKTINARVIANSDLEMDANGRLTNDFIDALDKAGANTLTGQQQEMYDAMSAEFVKSALDSDEQFDSVMRMALPTKGDSVPGRKSDAEYRTQMKRKVRAQMKIRQEQDAQKYASSRSRHGQSQSVMNRSSFMNKIDGSALDQLTTTAGSNVLDLFVPLALTAIGGAIQSGSIDNDELMQLGGATFTAFQYARTGTIESTQMDPTSYKKKLLGASAVGGIFKFKNALAQQGDENVGMAVAQIAVQEVTAASFNAIATPWLSKNIAEHGLGVKHAPAMNALDMKKYQAGQQLAGNIGASVISAISSTLISGLLMRGVESMSENVGQAIQSFLPAVQAVNSVNEAIAKKRQQENAYQDFEAETDNSEGQISDYMVITDATYNPDNYASMSDLQEEQELEPSNDGSLSIGLLN